MTSRTIGDVAPWADGFPYHAPVGSFRPNPFGLHDMHANVHEWCADEFAKIKLEAQDHRPGDGLTTAASSRPARTAYATVRGGSHYWGTGWARAARRLRFEPQERNNALGFRVARAVTP
jgi:formylglycine-generating enzyme required for sulfatase activity